jgi:hypothetical protein
LLADADGMNDFFESFYFIGPTQPSAGNDPDNDGYSNIEEYDSYSNPRDAGSTP